MLQGDKEKRMPLLLGLGESDSCDQEDWEGTKFGRRSMDYGEGVQCIERLWKSFCFDCLKNKFHLVAQLLELR